MHFEQFSFNILFTLFFYMNASNIFVCKISTFKSYTYIEHLFLCVVKDVFTSYLSNRFFGEHYLSRSLMF